VSLRSLETARLTLRPWTPADIDGLHALWTDADVRRWLWDDLVISREQAESTVAGSIRLAEEFGLGMWAAQSWNGEAIIGFCGFRFIEDTKDVELMYGFLPAYWGCGLATEAARAVLDYGFADGLFELVYGRTDAPNQASARVLERLGMPFEERIMIGDLPTLRCMLRRSAWHRAPALYESR
jgi:RimJ/RimL family protein N-acetyltransferase